MTPLIAKCKVKIAKGEINDKDLEKRGQDQGIRNRESDVRL
jgi:hypothetical protein